VVGALWWDRSRGLEQIDDLLARREAAEAGDGQFRAGTVKLMLDGVCETFTAAMSSPYLDGHGHSTSHSGKLFIEQDLLAEVVRRLAAEGFQLHFHALGDRAVTAALDAVANFQPLWACAEPQMEELTLPFVGAERAAWQYQIGSLARLGTKIAFGSDWPVSSPDPLQEIHVAVNRVLSASLGRAGAPECEDPFMPEQAVTFDTALDAFTAGVAYVNHDEDVTGRLVPGLRADVAVLDQDLYAAPASEIGATSVAMTVANGTVVFGDE
jgi:predicted amidohydrolase YtcJ